ncbi:hypothetical protein J8F10_30430 [Gemmata sp. G18]|uniref:Uncharacterized protein n=1 Tax=Gemmata palustris TaxID=2822762 RepID=A0ABS5C0Z8_9BACT|nr:hypothetical protein [Gemmata palustris]MBP3959583.1 hypothetical protein [Gemmata palustris]
MFQHVGDPRTVRDEGELAYLSARASGEREVAATVARSLFKSGRAAPAGSKSALTLEMERLSAECRALTGEAQRESIAQTLRFAGRRPARSAEPEMICSFCGECEIEGCFC